MSVWGWFSLQIQLWLTNTLHIYVCSLNDNLNTFIIIRWLIILDIEKFCKFIFFSLSTAIVVVV